MDNLPPVDRLKSELLLRLPSSEDAWTERKPYQKDPTEDIRRSLVAFANSVREGEWAVIFLGASNSGSHGGVPDPDALQRRVSEIAETKCYPPIVCKQVVLEVTQEGSPCSILAVVVGPSANRPHFAGLAYVRDGSRTIKASEQVFDQLIADRSSTVRALRLMKGAVNVRTTSRFSGLWFQFTATIRSIDLHTIEIQNNEGLFWPVPIEDVRIRCQEPGRFEIETVSQRSEVEHLEEMVVCFANYRLWGIHDPAARALASDYLTRQLDPLASQLLPILRRKQWDRHGRDTLQFKVFQRFTAIAQRANQGNSEVT